MDWHNRICITLAVIGYMGIWNGAQAFEAWIDKISKP